MARKIGTGTILIGAGILGTIIFWPQISQAIEKVSTSPHGGGGSGGGTGQDNPCQFIPGQRYVAPSGTGFVVVVGGRTLGVYPTQSQAEQAYNQATGC